MASEQGKQDIAAWLLEEWTSKLITSVETMTERKPTVTVGGRILLSAPEAPQEALWHSIPLTLGSDTVFFLGASAESWLHLGRSALAAAGIPDSSEEDARGTYLEILTQTTSAAIQSLAERLDRSVICLPAKEVTRAELNVPTGLAPIDITLSDPPIVRVFLGWTQAFETQLTASAVPLPGDPPPSEQFAKRPEFEKSRTLDLLMEVELPVSVSFGRAELPLRDVIKLSSGSIVELNRTISDPVEIIVNNCVIARGEVVVVEGNYGVRIQQVVSREERLRTLK